VGDAEEPRLQRAALVERVQLSIGLEQRLLHNVFAVHHRTGHAGAVAVQARPKRGDRLEERAVARVERAREIDILVAVHRLASLVR
jgi:hypothetical protein